MVRCLLCLSLLSGLLCAATSIRGDDGPVYTDPEQADDDFPYQGEYWGWERWTASHRSTVQIGLHVVALGHGEFMAVKYYGGLPGGGWDRRSRSILQGQRVGEQVQFRGDGQHIVVHPGSAEVLNANFRPMGTLQRVVRESPTLGAPAPPGALVLFNGSGTEHFRNARLTPEGWLQAGADTIAPLSGFRLHAEFMIPYRPLARGQGRGNSGFYLQSRYEVQVLDSFGLEGIENECGALYRVRRPDVNMCLPPLQWQTYDIVFQPPAFDEDGQKVADMRITIWHNGVLIHDDVTIPDKTGAGQPEGPHPLPMRLQEHGNPVVFRNLWMLPLSPGESLSDADWVPLNPHQPPIPIARWGG